MSRLHQPLERDTDRYRKCFNFMYYYFKYKSFSALLFQVFRFLHGGRCHRYHKKLGILSVTNLSTTSIIVSISAPPNLPTISLLEMKYTDFSDLSLLHHYVKVYDHQCHRHTNLGIMVGRLQTNTHLETSMASGLSPMTKLSLLNM